MGSQKRTCIILPLFPLALLLISLKKAFVSALLSLPLKNRDNAFVGVTFLVNILASTLDFESNKTHLEVCPG